MHSHFDFKDGPFTGLSNSLASVGKTKSGNVTDTNIPGGGACQFRRILADYRPGGVNKRPGRVRKRGRPVLGRTTWLLKEQIMLPAMPPLP